MYVLDSDEDEGSSSSSEAESSDEEEMVGKGKRKQMKQHLSVEQRDNRDLSPECCLETTPFDLLGFTKDVAVALMCNEELPRGAQTGLQKHTKPRVHSF